MRAPCTSLASNHPTPPTQALLPDPFVDLKSFNASTLNVTAKLANAKESAALAASKAKNALFTAKQTVVNAALNDKVGGVTEAAAQATAKKGPGFGAFKGKNVIVFLSDQEAADLDFMPPGWEEANLPAKTRLRKNGVEFTRAYTNACMCTAARATLFTGFLTTQNNARWVLETPMPNDLYPQRDTPDDLPGLAAAAAAAGYEVVYKGKMHLAKPINPDFSWTASDALRFGFTRWNYPDAGANQSLFEAGGSPAFNDRRFMESEGSVDAGEEGVFQYLRRRAADPRPFFLVVSLVNPHDVLFYPLQWAASGYSNTLLQGPATLPATWNENLSTKPSVQAQWAAFNVATGVAPQNAL